MYSMRSSAPRGSDSARWMPRASSLVRVAARRHAVSVDSLGDANVGIVEPRPTEEPANWRGADVAALDPGDEVRQHPALDG